MTQPDYGQLALAFMIGFVWGAFVIQWIYERRELKRMEREFQRALGNYGNEPPFRNPTHPPRIDPELERAADRAAVRAGFKCAAPEDVQ